MQHLATVPSFVETSIDKELLKSVVVYAIIITPLIFFFYDSFNLNANILSASDLFMGLNSYEHGSLIVAGFILNVYNLASFWLYYISGFNVEFTIIVLKVISAVLTILSSLLVYRIVYGFRRELAKVAFLGFLFNPYLIFVDYIWLQPEM